MPYCAKKNVSPEIDSAYAHLEPGVLIYLMREKNYDAAMVEAMVNRQSGLVGISGIDSDMRRLHQDASINADSRLAIEMFCYCVRKQVAAMIAVLDGVDLIVFTGGIGEHDANVRAAICGGLSWIGISDFTERRTDRPPHLGIDLNRPADLGKRRALRLT